MTLDYEVVDAVLLWAGWGPNSRKWSRTHTETQRGAVEDAQPGQFRRASRTGDAAKRRKETRHGRITFRAVHS